MAQKPTLARRAWTLLRLALLWARKGGIFKRGLLPSYLKSLRNTDSIRYGEREFSFDETPIFHYKMHKPASMRFRMPRIPCLNPPVDFEFDFNGDGEDGGFNQEERKSFLLSNERKEEIDCGADGQEGVGSEMVLCQEEEGIDVKAEEFIAKFYEQMKLQRQISYLQYNEMLNRGAS